MRFFFKLHFLNTWYNFEIIRNALDPLHLYLYMYNKLCKIMHVYFFTEINLHGSANVKVMANLHTLSKSH